MDDERTDKVQRVCDTLIHDLIHLEDKVGEKVQIGELALAMGVVMGDLVVRGTHEPSRAGPAAMEIFSEGYYRTLADGQIKDTPDSADAGESQEKGQSGQEGGDS